MGGDGIFDHQYERFYANREEANGYDFQQSPPCSLPVPKVSFAETLRWWTLDRWRRRSRVREERDRRLQEILEVTQHESK